MTLYTSEDVVTFIRDQLILSKNIQYGAEPVSEYEHALQCATLAEQSEADQELIIAALLHDFGRIIVADDQLSDAAEAEDIAGNTHDHGSAGAEALKDFFSDRVLDCIRYHAGAKRYLCTKDQQYLNNLSPTSKHTMKKQGGLMSPAEVTAFESMPHFKDMITVRRWDDAAKIPGMLTPPLNHWISLLRQVITL